MKALVTGATGFVGGALCTQLALDGVEVVRVVRDAQAAARVPDAICRDLSSTEPWDDAMRGVDVVFHLAAHVHQMDGGDPATFWRINRDATRELAAAALRAGVQRFVFLSTVKVHGESSATPFRESDVPAPREPYAESKLAAERELEALQASGLRTVVIRPPLVYGPGVKANFRSLLKAVDRGYPLPFGAVRNRRSLIFVGNLVNVLTTVATDDRAINRTFLVSDDEDLSTAALIRRLAAAFGKRPRLIPLPLSLLSAPAMLVGKRQLLDRLLGSLAVDITSIKSALDWRPPFSVDEGLRETTAWYRESQQ